MAVPDAAPTADAPAPVIPGDTTITAADAHVTFEGLPPLKIGMTVAEARTAVPSLAVPKLEDSTACTFVRAPALASDVLVMLDRGHIARIDVDSDNVATFKGAHVGDSEKALQTLYGNTLTSAPHKYLKGGHYLTASAPPPRDTTLKIVFETDGRRVTRYHVGRLPQVAWVEGCS